MACSLLFAGRVQIAVQGSRIAENGEKDSLRSGFWLLFLGFESSHSSHQE